MKYYYFKKRSSPAHIWTHDDTACRMYSTGGIPKVGKVHNNAGGRRICVMCKNVYERQKPEKVDLSDVSFYVW